MSSVKTHLMTLFTPLPGEQLWTGKSDVHQQPIASLSLESSHVEEDPSPRRDKVFVSVSHSCDKTSRLWTLAQDIIIEWEQRKKRRSAPCESRKTVFCVPCPVASDSCHDQASAWLLGDVAETEKSLSVAGVSVMSCSFCCLCHASHISFSFWFLFFSLPELVDEAKGLVVRGSAVLSTA